MAAVAPFPQSNGGVGEGVEKSLKAADEDFLQPVFDSCRAELGVSRPRLQKK